MQPYTSYYDLPIAIATELDHMNGLLKNHQRRTAVLAWHIGKAMKLSNTRLADLCYAAALHDIGVLSIQERDELIQLDTENGEPHALLGSAMLSGLPYLDRVADIIKYHHTRYDANLHEVPLEAYILHVADRIELLYDTDRSYHLQYARILELLSQRSGCLFHPDVIEAFFSIAHNEVIWLDLEHLTLQQLLKDLTEAKIPVSLDPRLLEQAAQIFSKCVDYRSQYTLSHSINVGNTAYTLAQLAHLDSNTASKLRIAGYLHDLGKLSICNDTLEKDDCLTLSEFEDLHNHSYYTQLMLGSVSCMAEITQWVASHHEKRDGSGYPFHLQNGQLSIETDILSFADHFTALAEERSYRSPYEKEPLLHIILTELVTIDNFFLYELLEQHYDQLYQVNASEQAAALQNYDEIQQTSKLF